MTIRNSIRESISALTGHVPRPDVEITAYLADILTVSTATVLAHPDQMLTDQQVLKVREMVQQRIDGVPLAYIRGRQDFFGRTFVVAPGVLIPRPATELLITAALQGPRQRIRTVIDVGTGSGCIACTLGLERPEWTITALDPSPIAREVAQRNVEQFQLDSRVHVQDGNLLTGIHHLPDLIVANLPYLHPDQLQEATIAHEPLLALDGGTHGTDLIESLLQQITVYRDRPIGLLIECDPRDANRLSRLMVDQLQPKQHRLLGEEAMAYGVAAWWY